MLKMVNYLIMIAAFLHKIDRNFYMISIIERENVLNSGTVYAAIIPIVICG